jgi:predicted transcriptional regulator
MRNNMKHRTEEEIAALILEAVANTNIATQTIIMYKAYLSYAQLKRFLSSLLEKGLIDYAKENNWRPDEVYYRSSDSWKFQSS